MRTMLQNFTDRLRGLSAEEKDVAIGGAVQELASTMSEMVETQRESVKQTERLHKERVDLANKRHAELVELINRRVDETERDVGERFVKLDAHIAAATRCQHEHDRILEDVQKHMKEDISIESWLGKHATAVIKAVLVFIGGAILAYTWKKVTGI